MRTSRINGRRTQATLAALVGRPNSSSGMAQLFAPSAHACGSGHTPFAACSRTRWRSQDRRTYHVDASHKQFSSSINRTWVISAHDGSRSLPEIVTRTLFGFSGAMISSGVSPAGVAAFSTAVSNSSGSAELPSSIKVTFSPVPGKIAEQLSDCLLGLGAQSVVVEESRDDGQAEQERFGAEAELWDNCRVLAHFSLEHDVESTVQTAQDILDIPDLSFTSEEVVDQEWVQQIKASYVPMQVAPNMYIVPEWSEPTDPSAVNIRLTPGVAFGTGEHPTTRLCLQYLASLADQGSLSGASIMDYGTGSGILALAGLLLGAANAVGTDTDPLAIRAAEANAALNGMQDKFVVVRCGANLKDPEPLAEVTGDLARQFDLVVANILRGPLIELQPRLTSYSKPGGRLALSGILTSQVPDVVDQYGPYFDDFQVSSDGSWALVTARRKAS